MRNEKDRQEKYLNYFDQNQQNSQRNQSRRQQEQTQWFSPEDDEDMKLADDSFDEEDDFDPAPPRKRHRLDTGSFQNLQHSYRYGGYTKWVNE